MTVRLWRIATDTPDYEAHDMSGKGAEKTGGRWNRPGKPMVYTASSASLACLETIVHLNASGLPLNRFLVAVDVPDALWRARKTYTAKQLPVGWSAIPAGKVSLDFGDAWLVDASSAVIEVPSVIVPEEFNILVNPLHPAATKIAAKKVRQWFYDSRLA